MATTIPPLNFTRSPDSFSTACEQQSNDDWEDSSSTTSIASAIPASALPVNKIDNKDSGWSDLAQTVELKRSDTISSQPDGIQRHDTIKSTQNKLVKRRPSIKPPKGSPTALEKSWVSYRCDIHAHSNTNYAAAASSCEQLILEANGHLIPFVYPGGLLYKPPPTTPNPLHSGDTIDSAGSHVSIASWKPFPPAEFSGLKLGFRHGRPDELQLLPLVRAVRRQTLQGDGGSGGEKALWGGRRSGVAKRCVSAWLGMVARDYGRGVSYIA
ncbi:hypothetical protein LTR02_002149 [Friedmanniomyces endolithicus]|nr:hypothetical protein LTR94_014003 [Friedmanniomyces endolithicus]KAK0785496.1 hypothetical protein LTR38_012330 [Friedmanniomyces endolithicus]KAK0790211.1 hypothetical protein LTR59_009311 [Friedmanniomyces endolithicus]KAK0808620.1 hypothetical protein LTR75_006197 [Friedmanniomyces endolithicus]KAK0876950.1 hypothetical protein LTR87_009188 [Friedmanniomyces endolithicus]